MKTIVILHGWAFETKKWQTFINLLSKKHKVKLLKIPGLTQKTNKVYTLEDYVSWLSSQLKDIQDPILLGHSNGGRIAIAFCSFTS